MGEKNGEGKGGKHLEKKNVICEVEGKRRRKIFVLGRRRKKEKEKKENINICLFDR